MSPMSPRLLRPRIKGDPDALRYIAAVQSADGQSLEAGVKTAIEAFVVGCKADGIWSSIKASCILMGARTLSGALVPLAGSAPTNNNFVAADYNRKTGLAGNASTKYLNSNRAGNADPQDNHHMSVYVSTVGTAVGFNVYASVEGASSAAGTTIGINTTSSAAAARSRNATAAIRASQHTATGLHGIARIASGSFTYRVAGSNSTETIVSESPPADPYFVFSRNIPSPGTTAFTNARLAFYSIGESLNLALLDSRVSALYAAIGAAI